VGGGNERLIDDSNYRMNADLAKANRRIAIWLFASFLSLYTTLTRGHFAISDEVQVYLQTRSLWERGDLSVTPQINTLPGRDGRFFAPYGVGQSVLALPFYLAGKTVHELLAGAGADSWIKTFAGPLIGGPDMRWGGEVEIFFVNLFGAFATAALMAVFFLFNIRLGATPHWAVAATIILGITTHVAGFGVEFLQHPAEALFLLLAFYFLVIDSETPNWPDRLLAGAMAGMMILVRASSLVLIPALTGYLIWHSFKRTGTRDPRAWLLDAIRSSAPFLIPVIAAVLVTMEVNYAKWGEYSIGGSYRVFNSLTNSWLVSIYGYLFSPGQSIFIFSPILLLAPAYFRPFARKHVAEAVTILGLTISYALFYGRSLTWHGQWCFGPRYLMATIPLLLLPLASWLGRTRPAPWIAVVSLAIVGAFIEVLHVAINVSFVYYREGYDKLVPADAYIFHPQISQIATHWRALLACDYRVDMWVVNIARQVGPWRVTEILAVLFTCALISTMKLNSCLRVSLEAEQSQSGMVRSTVAANPE
jgi:hypothetical protein